MKFAGIIAEYDPFHNGHAWQLAQAKALGAQHVAVAMSCGLTQRGALPLLPEAVRVQAALQCGADLIFALPAPCACAGAEAFARAGVRILAAAGCNALVFGAETPDAALLMEAARVLCSAAYRAELKQQLAAGARSFAAARQAAVEALCPGTALAALLDKPNNNLAVEYCKAILAQGSSLLPFPVTRRGSYHAETPDAENPSATSLRRCIASGTDWLGFVPPEAAFCFESAPAHTLAAGERAILARLRTMTDREFEALPYGSEGLWRRLMHASREEGCLEDILTRVKTKRYTRSRLDRMVLCAFLGLTQEDLAAPAPYARILAFDDVGRSLLKGSDFCKNLGWQEESSYAALEQRCNTLYGLFCRDGIPKADAAQKQRLSYLRR